MQKAVTQCPVLLPALVLCLLCAGCASRDASKTADPPESVTDVAEDRPGPEQDRPDDPLPPETVSDETTTEDPCVDYVEGQDTWLDKTQRGVSWTVCGSARWFDSFFGDRRRYESGINETYGRVGAFAYYDEYNNFDTDFRMRARVALPALKNRARLVVGRGDERELIEERGTSDGETLPPRVNAADEQTSWLVGVGYQRGDSLRRGFDTSVGVRLRTPPDPYVKARYREAWDIRNLALVRWQQTAFWTNRRGVGTTTNLDMDHLLSRQRLFRWANTATVAEDRHGLDWFSALELYQGLSNRRALTYRSFIHGQTGLSEPLNDYGVDVRYRQRVAREWFFIELRTGISFPKYTAEETRELNFGAGIGFEMYFGPVPDRELR